MGSKRPNDLGFWDSYWEFYVGERRFDRSPLYLGILFGMTLFGFGLVLVGPSPDGSLSELQQTTQKLLGFASVLGSAISLTGAFSGARGIARQWPLRRSYRWGIVGAPIVAVASFVYFLTISVNSKWWWASIGGALAPFLGMALLTNALYFVLEIRRITRNAETIAAIRNHNDSSDDGH